MKTVNQNISTTEQEVQIETSELTETVPKSEITPKQETDTEVQEPQLDEDILSELNIETIEAETDSSNDNSSFAQQTIS